MSEKEKLNYIPLVGDQVREYKNEIARLRIEIFHDFPYLYEGDFEYEKKYLKVYEESKRSILVLVEADNEIVGASTALPLSDENDYVIKPFIDSGMPVDKIFYFGESVLKKKYRGLGIGKKFFKYREEHALSYSEYAITCFCAVHRSENHPMKPSSYISLDNFWHKLGYHKENSLVSSFSWKDIGDSQETLKPMTYWMKEWKK